MRILLFSVLLVSVMHAGSQEINQLVAELKNSLPSLKKMTAVIITHQQAGQLSFNTIANRTTYFEFSPITKNIKKES